MDTRPSPPPADRVERRRRLARDEWIDAARGVVLEHGVRGFSLERAAAQVGLRKQAIYHYFESKEAVLVEQPSVVDSKRSVGQVLADSGTTVRAFARFEVGQG